MLVLAIHVLAIGCAWLALPPAAALLVTAGLAGSAWAGAAAVLLRGGGAIRVLDLRRDGSAGFADGHGEWHDAQVEGAPSLGAWLVIIRVATGARRAGALLVPGAADAGSMRRARIWARWRENAA